MRVLTQRPDGKWGWSPEMTLQVYLMLIFIYAAQLICHRLSRLLDKERGIQETFIQKKKYYLNKALDNCKGVVNNLETAYDDTFDLTSSGKQERYEILRYAANDLITLCGLYQSRRDVAKGDSFKIADEVKDKIREYPAPQDYDVDEALSYYNKD